MFVVLEVVLLGPATTAGIRPGDVITAVNGHDTESAEDFIAALRALDPGDQVELTVLHGGETQQISVTITARPASWTMPGAPETGVAEVGATARRHVAGGRCPRFRTTSSRCGSSGSRAGRVLCRDSLQAMSGHGSAYGISNHS